MASERWSNCLVCKPGVLHGEQGRDGRALHGALHSTGLGALPQQDRVLHGAASGALHSMGLGEVPHQARVSGALDGARTVLGGDPLQGRALHGVAAGALRSMDLGAVPQHHRALHSIWRLVKELYMRSSGVAMCLVMDLFKIGLSTMV